MTEGKTTIAPDVLVTIARLTALSVKGVSRMCVEPFGMSRLFQRGLREGVRIEVSDNTVNADVYLILEADVNIREVSRKIQQDIARAISEMVGMAVGRVNIHIEDIDYPQEAEA